MIYRPRKELHRELSAAFSAQPEICSIHVFGREVDGQPDEYSDIDMILCSDDLARSHRNYRDVLGKIAPIAVEAGPACTSRRCEPDRGSPERRPGVSGRIVVWSPR